MSGFNNTLMQAEASNIQTLAKYAQLHSAAAGSAGTSNVTTAARVLIPWTSPTGPGSFGLSTPMNFTGGAASGTVYSLTYWSASTGGTFYGEEPLTGDTAFNSSGQYSVTSLNITGSST